MNEDHFNELRGARPFKVAEVLSGEVWLGPGTTSTFLPIVLPYDCCAEMQRLGMGDPEDLAMQRECWVCHTIGWTHSAAAPDELRCLDHADFLAEKAKDLLRRAGRADAAPD